MISISGFSCNRLNTKIGFRAHKLGAQTVQSTGWLFVTTYRSSAEPGLYVAGGGFTSANGRYKAPKAGMYCCFAQVRCDSVQKSSGNYLRLVLSLNGQRDINNGMCECIDVIDKL